MTIQIELSIGDFLDRLSILDIKLEKIDDIQKRQNIKKEQDLYLAKLEQSQYPEEQIKLFVNQLREVNQVLWVIEDAIRLKESQKQFDEEFIELARSVYKTNDHRAKIKRQANETLGSDLVEEKSYQAY